MDKIMFQEFLINLIGSPPETLASPEMILYIFSFILLTFIIKSFFSIFYAIAGFFNGRDD